MSEGEPPGRRPIPPLIWAALALIVVAAFLLALRLLNPPGAGVGRPTPSITPGEPPRAAPP